MIGYKQNRQFPVVKSSGKVDLPEFSPDLPDRIPPEERLDELMVFRLEHHPMVEFDPKIRRMRKKRN
jgi:hypothetical protein